MRLRLLAAALAGLALSAHSAAAQGFPGASVGLPSTYVPRETPPNPFASNLPSAPPPVVVEERRPRARRMPPRDPDAALLPPARIPR
ncbi:hypothetical protein [Methylobacterium sp. A54F]